MKALILAGGFGTRLQPLTFIRPKHMLPIVDKPLIEHVVDYTIKNGFNEIIISIGSKKDFGVIKKYFNKKQLKARISFINEPKRLGGVGAIKYAVEKSGITKTFALILGDNMTDLDLKEMLKLHKTKKGICTIGLVKTKTPWSFGVVGLKGNQIINFVEKPKKGEEPSNWISTGIYIMEPKILEFIGDEFFDSTGMIFPYLLKKEQKLFGFKTDAFWIDVGRPESYLEATAHILKTKGVKNWVDKRVKTGEGTKIRDNVVLLAGTTIGKNCLIQNTIIFKNNTIGDNCEIVNAIIDEDCKIKSNSKISKVLGKGSTV